MIREAVAKNLMIYKKSKEYKNLMDTITNVNGAMHEEQKGFPGKLLKREERQWNKETHGEPHIHYTVLERTKNNNNLDDPAYAPLILNSMNKIYPNIER